MDNNVKLDLEKTKTEINKNDMKKEYEEYKNFIFIEKLNKSNILDIEKKWLENKMPLLKRQKAFSNY